MALLKLATDGVITDIASVYFSLGLDFKYDVVPSID